MDALSKANFQVPPQSIPRPSEMQNIDEAAQDFEAVFISEMLKPMFEGIETQAPFGGGKGEEVFRSILLQEYGKSIAKQGGIGLADAVKAELIKAQGG